MSLLTCILFLALCSPISAAPSALGQTTKPDSINAVPSLISRDRSNSLTLRGRLGDLGEIVVDPHPPSKPPRARRVDIHQRDHELEEEDGGEDEDETTTTAKTYAVSKTSTPSTTTSTSDPTDSSTTKSSHPTKTKSSTPETNTPTPSDDTTKHPLPSPFDSNIGTNFTTRSCPQFFENFLTNATFQDCHAMSMLLLNSLSFFQASQSTIRLSRSLDASCAAPKEKCKAMMEELATAIKSPNACKADFELEQPLVVRAYNSMLAYTSIYEATCLVNPDTNNYCFADAMGTGSENSYVYFLPLGLPMPGSSSPTCSKCLQATMQRFSNAAKIKGQPIVNTYVAAAEQININCGPSFVVAAVAVGSEKGAGSLARMVKGGGMEGLMTALGYLLVFNVGIPLLSMGGIL
ncbi:hypothetical protein FQN51_002016 [Onygenales sp. PD_10]|nr:hypothetical protein FQN51_002016 [Onygenales sp. PD_10]